MIQFFSRWHILLVVSTTLFFSYLLVLLMYHSVSEWSVVFSDYETVSSAYPVSFPAITNLLPAPASSSVLTPLTPPTVLPATMVFVGDIMLARSVEWWMQEEGVMYPFTHVPDIIGTSTAVFANFEASIPLRHERTIAYSTRFSTDAQYIEGLHKNGITHVSLANNHTFDFGSSGERNTRSVLEQSGLVPFGHADRLATSSITRVQLGSTTVTVLALQTVYGHLNRTELEELVTQMRATSDLQFVYVHWGTEYAPSHDTNQKQLAEYLVSLGVDAIIGHHPHVVEDIQLVAGVPVFYSLGNFIFDQYFSEAVQQGLTLQLELGTSTLAFTLLPVTSLGTHAQPRLMVDIEREQFLSALAKRSDETLQSAISNGSFSVPHSLQN